MSDDRDDEREEDERERERRRSPGRRREDAPLAQVAFADAAHHVVWGYLLCITAFMLAAAFCYATRRRERVLENLLLGAIAFAITYFILPWCAGS